MKKFLPYVVITLVAGTLTVFYFQSNFNVAFNVTGKNQMLDLNNFKEFNPLLLVEKTKTKPLKGLTAQMLTKITRVGTDLNETEEKALKVCVKNHRKDSSRGFSTFWFGNTNIVRHTHHKYLTRESFILDVGGNVGTDAEAFLNTYNPRLYIILEPLESHFKRLVKKFENNSEITVYNIGLAKKNYEFKVRVTGNDGDATSLFQSGGRGTVPFKVINATNFFINLGVGFYDIDLITINCEGCEYEVLESITSTTLVRHFKHIQFATHPKLPGLKDPISRYCKLQNLLARTHKISYQYKFTWETWIRKNFQQ